MLFFLVLLFVTGCSQISVLDPKSSTGKDQAFLIWLSLGVMAIVLLTVFILFARFVIKYRYTKEKADFIPKDVKGSKKLELTWTIIPFILLAILAVPTVKMTYEQSPSTEAISSKEGVHIQVTAQQFSWTFEHENGKTVHDELVIPEGESIVFQLESNDVIHSFWIPQLAGKVDVIPNKPHSYVIENAEKGEYEGKCAEYCGIQHTNMVFETTVVSKEDYAAYLKKPDNQEGK
ncbi:cytochrome c oxidase subunit II [Virgibacillus sp. W0181]|uniref:cytochrome c oxidase subunit II n=1 Tax=Virgibacillus sp. W0181 TaxID=3391581 RepID=UPI003F47D21C